MRNLNAVIQRWEVLSLLLLSSALQILWAYYLPVALYLDIPLVLVLYIGWYSKPARGALAGTFFGVVQDAVYGTFLGLNGLSKTLVGFTASFLSRLFRLEDAFARMILIAAVAAMDNTIVYLLFRLLEQPVSERFWLDTLIKAAVTGVVGGIGSRFYDHFKFPRKDFRRVQG
jgi:rod shape-determining protein MreD